MEVSLSKSHAAKKDLDQWIEQLFQCKQLTENQVTIVCAKVRFFSMMYLFDLFVFVSRIHI